MGCGSHRLLCAVSSLPVTPAKHSAGQGQRGLLVGGSVPFLLDFGKFQKETVPGVPPESGGGAEGDTGMGEQGWKGPHRAGTEIKGC